MQAPVSVATSTRCVHAELLRVPERVAKNQPAFGVGVDDLDGLAARASITSPGRIALPPTMFSAVGMTPIDAERRPEAREREHRAGDGGAAGHVVSSSAPCRRPA